MDRSFVAVLVLCGCFTSNGRRERDASALRDSGQDAACAEPDADGDGHASEACGGDDCHDGDLAVHPDAPDLAGDAIDGDCDGLDGVDGDRDGHASVASGGDDCDDADAAVHPGSDEEGWTIEEVPDPAAYLHPSLALDGSTLHLAYSTGSFGVHLAVRNVRGRDVETVFEKEELAGVQRVALAIDGSGGVHIVTSDEYQETSLITHWSNPGGPWTSEQVSGPSDLITGSIALALGPDGAAHMVYGSESSRDDLRALRWATNGTGSWAQTTLEDGADGYVGGGVAVDPTGTIHVSYSSWDSEAGLRLVYATIGGDSDVGETIDEPMTGPAPLVLDRDGVPNVVYHGAEGERSGDLHHARRSEVGWEIDTIEGSATGTRCQHASVAVGPEGGLHVSYGMGDDVGNEPCEVRYATNAGGSWATEPVGSAWQASVVALAVDGAEVHLAFVSSDDSDPLNVTRTLLHAYRPLPDGIDDDCDGSAW